MNDNQKKKERINNFFAEFLRCNKYGEQTEDEQKTANAQEPKRPHSLKFKTHHNGTRSHSLPPSLPDLSVIQISVSLQILTLFHFLCDLGNEGFCQRRRLIQHHLSVSHHHLGVLPHLIWNITNRHYVKRVRELNRGINQIHAVIQVVSGHCRIPK